MNHTWTTIWRYNAVCGVGALYLLTSACSQELAEAEEIEAPTQSTSTMGVSRHFYGYMDPSTGEVKLSSEPIVIKEGKPNFGAAGYLVPNQFGEVPIVQDGVNGSNPPSTFELQGGSVSVNNAGQSAGQTQCPGSNFTIDITLRHFFGKATFEDVFVEFTKLEPGISHYPYDTDSAPSGLTLNESIGLYSYGTLSDANSNSSTRTWKFERCTSEPMTFEISVQGTCVPEPGETALSACLDNPGYRRMAVSNGVSCYRENNSATCWGSNAEGVLSTGDFEDSALPLPVTKELTNKVSFLINTDGGEQHACARLNDGTAKCWGDNAQGQLGDGTISDSKTGVLVKTSTGSALKGVSSVAVGKEHSCLLTNKGKVKCWGFNGYGQLGTGNENSSKVPRDVVAPSGAGLLSDVVKIESNEHTTCALLGTGEVVCWGFNRQGQLGNGTRTDSTRPVYVRDASSATLTGMTDLSVGLQHTCAVSASGGQAYCWGDNKFRQLGDGTSSDRGSATSVVSEDGTGMLANVSQIAAGNFHTCALLNSGEVRCWGTGVNLGQGSTAIQARPVAVKNVTNSGNLTGITSLKTENDSTCALTQDKNVVCWGANGAGQLGNNTTTRQLVPVQVLDLLGDPQLENIEQILVGGAFACAVDDSGDVFCWGNNGQGQLGTGDLSSSTIPVVTKLDRSTLKSPLLGITSIAAGAQHLCTLLDTKAVKCWGENGKSQLGTGNEDPYFYPQDVLGIGGSGLLSGVIQLHANNQNTCALLESSEIACWGTNLKGQLGNGTRKDSTVPLYVKLGAGNLSDVVQVSVGSIHACAVTSFNDVYCWGFNKFSQLGDGTTTDRLLPVNVRGLGGSGFLRGVVELAAGSEHTCALINTGEVYCWGRSGRIGLASGAGSRVPVKVPGVGGTGTLSNVVGISSFNTHTLALLEDGTVVGWGINSNGQLGDGTSTTRLSPVNVRNVAGTANLTGVREVEAGENHSCAFMADRTVKCWGNGAEGQLGDGTFSSSFLPVDVTGL